MTHAVRSTTAAEREAVRSVKRACYAGLDSVALRQEVARRSAVVLPREASALVAIDPETGLFAHGWMEAVPDGLVRNYMTYFYPLEITDYLDLSRSGRTTTTFNPEPFLEMLRGEGLGDRARTALCSEGRLWGSWCVFREPGANRFTDREIRFLRAVAPHIGYGMRSAAILDAARPARDASGPNSPGVVVLDARRRVSLRSGPAAAHLDDLASVGTQTERFPYAVLSLLARLDAAHAGAAVSLDVSVRAQGRSGEWYVLRASLAEPDAAGESAAVIVIEAATAPAHSLTLSHMYGLTPREHEVVLLVVRGESTKRIAARLCLSPYTVQDHLGSACEKVGVRGRKALMAKLWQDGYTPADA